MNKKYVMILAGIFLGMTSTTTAWAQSFNVTTSSGTVNSAYVTVTGTESGITWPMWYEVHSGSSTGPMVDFGSFPPAGN